MDNSKDNTLFVGGVFADNYLAAQDDPEIRRINVDARAQLINEGHCPCCLDGNCEQHQRKSSKPPRASKRLARWRRR